MLKVARQRGGLTQVELAAKSGTSQATLSEYERGLKSPTLKVAERILEATGHDFNLGPHIDWVEHHPPGIVRFWAPSILWTVPPPNCFATLSIPDAIEKTGMREWDMRDREQRKGVYEQFIRRSLPMQMIRWMDGSLLVDVWDELDLPDPVRDAWKRPIWAARQKVTSDTLVFTDLGDDIFWTADAVIRTYEAIPDPPPKKWRQRRTRFDRRPPPPD